MLLNLMVNASPENTIGKVLTPGTSLTINLKRGVDIVTPTILLSEVAGVDYLDYNYAHIPELGRYYFINSIESVNGSLWSLSMVCDVLQTYGAGIKASVARYRRALKGGDNHMEGVDFNVNSDITLYQSNVTLPNDVHTNVLTVVEGGSL